MIAMKRLRTTLLAALAGLASTTAAAAQAPPCADRMGTGAIVQLPEVLRETQRIEFSHAIYQALQAPGSASNWPEDPINRAPACVVSTFQVADDAFVMSGGQGPVPERWAKSATSDTVYFLAQTPEGAPATSVVARYFLAAAAADEPVFFVLRAYDARPSDLRLQTDIQASGRADFSPVGLYDRESGAVSLFTLSEAAIGAQLFGPVPKDGRSATLYTPDGRYFIAGGARKPAAVIMRASGFACPASVGAMKFTKMEVMNGEDEKLDLACNFEGEEGWITLFVYRSGGRPARDAFEAIRRDMDEGGPKLAHAPELIRLGGAKHFPLGGTWRASEGDGTGVWFDERGGWYVELRATWSPDGRDEAKAAVEALQAIVYD
jgi:hypothetical protein